jgi:hypothetical protein
MLQQCYMLQVHSAELQHCFEQSEKVHQPDMRYKKNTTHFRAPVDFQSKSHNPNFYNIQNSRFEYIHSKMWKHLLLKFLLIEEANSWFIYV